MLGSVTGREWTMKIVTTSIYPDEPAYGIFEGPEHGRWLQKVWVIRGDAIAQYRTDLGAEEDFPDVVPLVMPSYGDDTVAQLQYYAEKNRHDHYWANRSKEMLAESTLIQDHLELLEKETLAVLNRTVMGPMVKVQRNAFSRATARRQLKERYNDKSN